MAAPKKKSVKPASAKKKATPATPAKPSKAVLLKAAKAGLNAAKATLVQAKRDLAGIQKAYLSTPTKENAAEFRGAPSAVINANRKVAAEGKKVARLS